MNEKIKELSRLAQALANANCADEFGAVDEHKRRNSFEQKFALLLIRECATVAKKAENMWSDDFAWQAILKHFGVK